MCEVVQLLYSNEGTRDQYSFNGQMRTGTGPALVETKPDHSLLLYTQNVKSAVSSLPKIKFVEESFQETEQLFLVCATANFDILKKQTL